MRPTPSKQKNHPAPSSVIITIALGFGNPYCIFNTQGNVDSDASCVALFPGLRGKSL